MGINFGTAATVLENNYLPQYYGQFSCVRYYETDERGIPTSFPVRNERLARASAADFKKIPGAPIAYWVSEKILDTFSGNSFGGSIVTEGQNKTADNDQFLRLCWEVSSGSLGKDRKWLLYSKGGRYRRWFGNLEYAINWSAEAREYYRRSPSCRIISERFWYKDGVTWTDIATNGTAFRYLSPNTTFDMKGPTAFLSPTMPIYAALGLLNSAFVSYILPVLNPTMSTQLRDVRSVPLPKTSDWMHDATPLAARCVLLSRADWDSYETSWDFADQPLLRPDFHSGTLAATYDTHRALWRNLTLEMPASNGFCGHCGQPPREAEIRRLWSQSS